MCKKIIFLNGCVNRPTNRFDCNSDTFNSLSLHHQHDVINMQINGRLTPDSSKFVIYQSDATDSHRSIANSVVK